MRLMTKPHFTPDEVYASCINGISNKVLQDRLASAVAGLVSIGVDYEMCAKANTLHTFVAHGRGNGSGIVHGDLTKDELIDLYNAQMVGSKKAARNYYDKIMMLAPLNLCPLCGIGHVSTLDHFLAKSQYPIFSVLPNNLIPTCMDCNKGKKSSFTVVKASNQLLHPYFEAENVETDEWLFSRVLKTEPATVEFFVRQPSNWSSGLYDRAINHFHALDLGRRYAIQASCELQGVSSRLMKMKTVAMREKHLSLIARGERQNQSTKNSWKAAFYEGLSNCTWFLSEGYLPPQ